MLAGWCGWDGEGCVGHSHGQPPSTLSYAWNSAKHASFDEGYSESLGSSTPTSGGPCGGAWGSLREIDAIEDVDMCCVGGDPNRRFSWEHGCDKKGWEAGNRRTDDDGVSESGMSAG